MGCVMRTPVLASHHVVELKRQLREFVGKVTVFTSLARPFPHQAPNTGTHAPRLSLAFDFKNSSAAPTPR